MKSVMKSVVLKVMQNLERKEDRGWTGGRLVGRVESGVVCFPMLCMARRTRDGSVKMARREPNRQIALSMIMTMTITARRRRRCRRSDNDRSDQIDNDRSNEIDSSPP